MVKSCKGFTTRFFEVSEDNILLSTGKIPRKI